MVGSCRHSPLTAPPYSILKRSRKTSNSAWSLAAHPCPSSWGRRGQGWLRVSTPTLAMVLTLHGGRRWPRDPPTTTGPQQGPSGWNHSSPHQDLKPRGSCRPKDTHTASLGCHTMDLAEQPQWELHKDTPGPPPATPAQGFWGTSSGLSSHHLKGTKSSSLLPELPWQVPTTPQPP